VVRCFAWLRGTSPSESFGQAVADTSLPARDTHVHLVASATFFSRLRDTLASTNAVSTRETWAAVHAAANEAQRALGTSPAGEAS
jgi:hypothetical protein